MSIRVEGNLVDPGNVGVAGASIRFVSESTTLVGAIKGAYITGVTSAGGAYVFPVILPGTYRVYVTHGDSKDKFIDLGTCTIATTATGTKSLQQLDIV